MNKTDELSKVLSIISSIVPPIGFVLYFSNKRDYPNKAKKALNAALIGIPIGFVMGKFVMPYLIGQFS